MRATALLCGIRGVFPVIKQHAPSCISELPSFAALPKATRLAIDATLLVQRLHFADDAHPQRHVLGFYRLVRQLRDHGLVPIMVFDNVGQGARLPAKMREHERRRRARSTLALRAHVEALRARRLGALQNVLRTWQSITEEQREEVTALLMGWQRGVDAQQQQQETQREEGRAEAATEEAFGGSSSGASEIWTEIGAEQARGTFDEINSEEVARVRLQDLGMANHELGSYDGDSLAADELAQDPSYAWWSELFREAQRLPSSAVFDSDAKQDNIWTEVQHAERNKALLLASQINNLMRQFQPHKQESMQLQGDLLSPRPASWPMETPTQHRLTQAEQSVYARLTAGHAEADAGLDLANDAETARKQSQQPTEQSTEPEPAMTVPTDNLDDISAQSAAIYRAYTRSGTPLSSSVFQACADLCELLKVPVLWTGDGSRELGRPHEGEAMAAMLVRHGYADIVVSEDSDVLLYDVPLLRGVMGHKKLELVDSASVRRHLFPPAVDAVDWESEHEKAIPIFSATETEAEDRSRRQMLEFALLCGTDFNRTLPGIAARRALSLVRQFKSIDAIHAEALRRQEAKLSKAKPMRIRRENTENPATPDASRPFDALQNASARSVGLTGDAALRMPDDMTWREYTKELTRARHVFTHPPSLYKQLRKIRDLKRPLRRAASDQPAEAPVAEAQSPRLKPLTGEENAAVQAFLARQLTPLKATLNTGREEDGDRVGGMGAPPRSSQGSSSSSSSSSSPAAHGFGHTPFRDGGPIASWSW